MKNAIRAAILAAGIGVAVGAPVVAIAATSSPAAAAVHHVADNPNVYYHT